MYNWTQYLKESHSYSKKGNNPAMRFMFYFKKKFSFISSRSRSRNQTFKPFSPINLLLNDETSQQFQLFLDFIQ